MRLAVLSAVAFLAIAVGSASAAEPKPSEPTKLPSKADVFEPMSWRHVTSGLTITPYGKCPEHGGDLSVKAPVTGKDGTTTMTQFCWAAEGSACVPSLMADVNADCFTASGATPELIALFKKWSADVAAKRHLRVAVDEEAKPATAPAEAKKIKK